jgi:hypothetical protein
VTAGLNTVVDCVIRTEMKKISKMPSVLLADASTPKVKMNVPRVASKNWARISIFR